MKFWNSSETLKLWNSETMKFWNWNSETLKFWNFEILKTLTETLKLWNFDFIRSLKLKTSKLGSLWRSNLIIDNSTIRNCIRARNLIQKTRKPIQRQNKNLKNLKSEILKPKKSENFWNSESLKSLKFCVIFWRSKIPHFWK